MALDPTVAKESLESLKQLAHALDKNSPVLVVEDNKNDRFLLTKLLENYRSFKVFEAADGREAVSMICNIPFEIVFLDLALPGMGGLDILRVHKSKSKYIIITGLDDAAPDVMEALRLGAVMFITKPVTIEKLRHILG